MPSNTSRKGNQQAEIPRIAATGMYLVAAQLSRQGLNVTPTSRNHAGADLLITDDNCQIARTIQVKTTDQSLRRRRGWLIGKNAVRTQSLSHFYVFVMLNGGEKENYFVVPSNFVAKNIRGAESMPEFRLEDAREYADKWNLLVQP